MISNGLKRYNNKSFIIAIDCWLVPVSLYSLCVNSGGVVETSDVCLDCHTVIDRDVDLNRLLLWCLEKKSCKMLNAYFSPFFARTVGGERENMTYCTQKGFVLLLWRQMVE